MGDNRGRSAASTDPELGALALFPSELDAPPGSTSSQEQMGVAADADFPSDGQTTAASFSGPSARTRSPRPILTWIESAHPSSEPTRRAVPSDALSRPVLPRRRDGGIETESRSRRWLTATAIAVAAVATIVIVRPQIFSRRVEPSHITVPLTAPESPASDSSPSPAVEPPHAPPAAGPAVSNAPGSATPRPQDAAVASGRPTTTPPPRAAVVSQPPPRTVTRPPADPSASAAAGLPIAPAPTPRFQGTINVDAPAAGARVYIGGKLVGVTPLVDWQVPAGSHVVRVELEGYERWSRVVQIVSGKSATVIADLREER